MRVLRLPATVRALIFDIDGTLYTNPAYQTFQEDALIERLAGERGESAQNLRKRIDAMRAERAASGSGRGSLGNAFIEFGVDIATSARWRAELIEPGDWLEPDARLVEAVGTLAARYALAAVTNNPRSVGLKALAALGAAGLFQAVVGLDDTMVSKPAPEPFSLAARLLSVDPASCVSVGDRRDVDLDPAMELGMGAILVDGVTEVYELPRLLDFPPPRDML